MNVLRTYFAKPFVRHLLFWAVVYLYFVLSANLNNYAGYLNLLESSAALTMSQMIAAYTIMYVLIPKFLNKKKIALFIFSVIVLCTVIFALYVFVRINYFDLNYSESYNAVAKMYAKLPYWDRVTDFSVFLSKSILFLTPTVLLMMWHFYKNQQNYLRLSEQKKIAELTALKNQLNPHFLFNTLNNLYALAVEKSDTTPEVIERLSDMLDYMLYRCNENFVPLSKEVALIENYLALEKIRYGKRVVITLDNRIEEEVEIAPLILLTFIENAFKHGVVQELKMAKINIFLAYQNGTITFRLGNTKPNGISEEDSKNVEALGLNNVRKQLNLLYPEAYDIKVSETETDYSLELNLHRK